MIRVASSSITSAMKIVHSDISGRTEYIRAICIVGE
jgi:hypothetical protein